MQKCRKDWAKVKYFDMHLNGIISIILTPALNPQLPRGFRVRKQQAPRKIQMGLGINKWINENLQP